MNEGGRIFFNWAGILTILTAIGVGGFWWVAQAPEEPMAQMQHDHGEAPAQPPDEPTAQMQHDHGETPAKQSDDSTAQMQHDHGETPAKPPDEPMAQMQHDHGEAPAKPPDEPMAQMQHDHGEAPAKPPDEPMAQMQHDHGEAPAKPPDEPMAQMQHDHGGETSAMPSKAATATPDDTPSHSVAVTINSQKQRLIGVKTEPAQVREMTNTIRTVGQVEVDERRLIQMHTKLEGWVQKLYVKFTGEQVQKDQKLFEIYSPELVSTQKEYLLALEAVHELGNVGFPEVAESTRSLLEVTRQRLMLWDIVPEAIERLKKTRKVLRTLPLHAPGSGYVLDMHIREGMHVTPDMKLYTLVDLSNVWVLADVYESEVPLVHLGQEATLTLSYFPGQTFTGKVTYIYPVLEATTRTVKVRFEIPNPEWKIKPGMFANVNFKIYHGKRLIVPSTAVLDSGTEQLVFVDQGQGRFEPRTVKIGSRTKDTYEILKGVDPGEMVVTRGNFLIDSESNLKASMETMMPDADAEGDGGSSMHEHMGH